MARQRRAWESLKPDYRKRLSRGGITKQEYESGKKLSDARGHKNTPEHGLKDAQKHPEKYSDYIRKRQVPKPAPSPVPASVENEARTLNTWRDKAYNNIVRKLGNLIKFDADAVSDRVYGGAFTPMGFTTTGMSLAEAQWTARAKKEELRAHASPQYHTNPWWYHSW